MKIKIWIVATCIPGEVTPSLPAPFGTEAEAEAYADKMMRNEWESNGPEDDETGERLPYPGDWREAQDAIHECHNLGYLGEEQWGQWEVTAHVIEVGAQTSALTIDRYRDRDIIEEVHRIGQRVFTGQIGTEQEPAHVQTLANMILARANGATTESNPDYLAQFPVEARPYADRAYQDGYVDGVEQERSTGHVSPWERRGSAVFEEGDGTPGAARCVAELHPVDPSLVQQVVDAHNASFAPGKIAVIIEGGALAGIVSDGPLIGLEITTIDYDTDGADEGTTEPVTQDDGSTQDAYVSSITIERATITIPDLVELPPTDSATQIALAAGWHEEADGSWYRAPLSDAEGSMRVTAESAHAACLHDNLLPGDSN